ncbi:MAG TPA: hypothetical protein VGM11_08835, partial [Acidobacteriaceae bacterium]
PQQILDLGMTSYALNTKDKLYRYEDNPAKMQAWLAVSHTDSPRAPAAPFLPILKPESVTAPGGYNVRFTLDRPCNRRREWPYSCASQRYRRKWDREFESGLLQRTVPWLAGYSDDSNPTAVSRLSRMAR